MGRPFIGSFSFSSQLSRDSFFAYSAEDKPVRWDQNTEAANIWSGIRYQVESCEAKHWCEKWKIENSCLNAARADLKCIQSQNRVEMTIACWAEIEVKCGISWHELCRKIENCGKLTILSWNATLSRAGSGPASISVLLCYCSGDRLYYQLAMPTPRFCTAHIALYLTILHHLSSANFKVKWPHCIAPHMLQCSIDRLNCTVLWTL